MNELPSCINTWVSVCTPHAIQSEVFGVDVTKYPFSESVVIGIVVPSFDGIVPCAEGDSGPGNSPAAFCTPQETNAGADELLINVTCPEIK
jgi:hypothetical protein